MNRPSEKMEGVFKFLEEHGMEEHYQLFEDQKVDFESLKLLDMGAIIQLFPFVGLQVKLKCALKKLNSSIATKVDHHNNERSLSTASTVSFNSDSDVDSTCPVSSLANVREEVEKRSIDSPPPHKRPCNESFTEKEMLGNSTINLNLKKLLQETSTGSSLLLFYNKKDRLEPSHRQNLAQIIIDHALLQSTSLKEIDFRVMTDQIIALFPNESRTTYFIASCDSNTGRQSSGRLVGRYRNRRRSLVDMGILSVKEKFNDVSQTTSTINVVTDVKAEEACKWLRSNSLPWSDVLKKWEDGSLLRIKLWDEEKKSFLQISKDWPALAHPNGFSLIEIDFNKRYGCGMSKSLIDRWGGVSSELLKIVRRRFSNDKPLMMLVDTITNTESQNLIVFQLLPKLLPQSMVVAQGKRWHPTFSDSQDAFLMHVKDASEIEENLEKMKSRSLPLQPLCLAVGNSLTEVNYYFNYIDGVLYKHTDVVGAIDSLFKTFMVFNIEYPKQCFNVWLFIQQYIYKIFTKYDKQIQKSNKVYNSVVSELISDLTSSK